MRAEVFRADYAAGAHAAFGPQPVRVFAVQRRRHHPDHLMPPVKQQRHALRPPQRLNRPPAKINVAVPAKCHMHPIRDRPTSPSSNNSRSRFIPAPQMNECSIHETIVARKISRSRFILMRMFRPLLLGIVFLGLCAVSSGYVTHQTVQTPYFM